MKKTNGEHKEVAATLTEITNYKKELQPSDQQYPALSMLEEKFSTVIPRLDQIESKDQYIKTLLGLYIIAAQKNLHLLSRPLMILLKRTIKVDVDIMGYALFKEGSGDSINNKTEKHPFSVYQYTQGNGYIWGEAHAFDPFLPVLFLYASACRSAEYFAPTMAPIIIKIITDYLIYFKDEPEKHAEKQRAGTVNCSSQLLQKELSELFTVPKALEMAKELESTDSLSL
ncbi:MAG: hypothetical protein JSR33_09945 [Proteobacteria bacterium]|nr:hypothetical protein [Pseudomonadota bacterium]